MLTFKYELLVFSQKLETSYEEENRKNTNGARPLGIKTSKEELGIEEGRIALKWRLVVKHMH